MDLCTRFKRFAVQTWDLIEKSRAIGFQLKEETITDLLLLDLRFHHSGQVLVHEFTKREESTTGGDWEWWFFERREWLGFRIQAKIINPRTESFDHLHYKRNGSSIFQCDRLISDSLKKPFPRCPLYCLYVNSHDSKILRNMSRRYTLTELFGCSLISAYEVQSLRARRRLADVEQRMTPWHTLVCGGMASKRGLRRMSRLAQKHFPGSQDATQKFILSDCPDYVKAIATKKMQEVESPDENLQGIVFVDLSDS